MTHMSCMNFNCLKDDNVIRIKARMLCSSRINNVFAWCKPFETSEHRFFLHIRSRYRFSRIDVVLEQMLPSVQSKYSKKSVNHVVNRLSTRFLLSLISVIVRSPYPTWTWIRLRANTHLPPVKTYLKFTSVFYARMWIETYQFLVLLWHRR
jgi:hypothetical protein